MGIDEEIANMTQEEQLELLVQAATLGRCDAIQKLLQANKTLQRQVDENGASSLHYAVHHSQVDAVRALLRGGIPTDIIAIKGEFSGKSALDLIPDEEMSQSEAAMRCCFASEALQSIMLGDVMRTEELLRSGVRPCDKVGSRDDDKTLLEWAADLGDGAGENEAIKLIQGMQRDQLEHSDKQVTEVKDTTVETYETTVDDKVGTYMKEDVRNSPLRVSHRSVCAHCGHDPSLTEEQDVLIGRLRQMLQVMADEQQMLNKLVHKQGTTSVAEHFKMLKQRATQLEEELKMREAENVLQEEKAVRLQELLRDEVEAHEATKVMLQASETSKFKLLLQASQTAPHDFEYDSIEESESSPESPIQGSHIEEGRSEGDNTAMMEELDRDRRQFHDRFQRLERPDREESGVGWWRWSSTASPQKVGSRLVLRV